MFFHSEYSKSCNFTTLNTFPGFVFQKMYYCFHKNIKMLFEYLFLTPIIDLCVILASESQRVWLADCHGERRARRTQAPVSDLSAASRDCLHELRGAVERDAADDGCARARGGGSWQDLIFFFFIIFFLFTFVRWCCCRRR